MKKPVGAARRSLHERGKSERMKNKCVRGGIVCGHRRSISSCSGSGVTSSICHYLLDTGEKRGCPPGKECIHYTAEKCVMAREQVYIDKEKITWENF